MLSTRIVGTGAFVPARVLTNADLERLVDTSDEWIVTRTGISERHVAADDEATSDLSLPAAQAALQAAGLDAADLDMILVATATPDMAFPSTACVLQDRLGARRAGALDVSAACSGFIYALGVADGLVRAGTARTVLVIGAEALTKVAGTVTVPDELPSAPKSKRRAPPTRSSMVARVNQASLPCPVAIACQTCSGVPGTRNSISTQRLPSPSFLIGMTSPQLASSGAG